MVSSELLLGPLLLLPDEAFREGLPSPKRDPHDEVFSSPLSNPGAKKIFKS